jgi:hypothetical protein
MYATIRRHLEEAALPGARASAGRALAARLGALPGFVAYLLLEGPDGGCVAVCLFEDRGGLEDAERLAAAWRATDGASPWAELVDLATGEVIVQRGL